MEHHRLDFSVDRVRDETGIPPDETGDGAVFRSRPGVDKTAVAMRGFRGPTAQGVGNDGRRKFSKNW